MKRNDLKSIFFKIAHMTLACAFSLNTYPKMKVITEIYTDDMHYSF